MRPECRLPQGGDDHGSVHRKKGVRGNLGSYKGRVGQSVATPTSVYSSSLVIETQILTSTI